MQTRNLVCLAFILSGTLEAGWLDRKAEGWAWYEDDKGEPEPDSPQKQILLTPSDQLAIHKKELEDLLAEAILDPSDENTFRYMQAQSRWLAQSAHFANTWSHILLSQPELDPTATTFATSQYGRLVQKAHEQEMRDYQIKDLGNRYGLFFFYEGANKASQALAKVVEAFTQRHEWSVIGISVDGTIIDEVRPSKFDDGIAAKMGVAVFPALIAVDPKSQQIIPIAFGLQSLDRIERNISLQLNSFTQE